MTEIQPNGYSPTVIKRALSRMLVDLRKSVGMTTHQVLEELGWSPTKLTHIEKGRWVRPNGDDVADLCELYGVPTKIRDAMAERPNVDVQVLSIASGHYPGGSEPFAYLSFPDKADRDLIYIETTVDNR